MNKKDGSSLVPRRLLLVPATSPVMKEQSVIITLTEKSIVSCNKGTNCNYIRNVSLFVVTLHSPVWQTNNNCALRGDQVWLLRKAIETSLHHKARKLN